VGRQAEALLGLGDLLTQLLEVTRRHGAVAWLLGGLGGAGQEPFVPAEFQGDVQGPGRGRGRGHVWFSVCKDSGVLPDGDLYHLGYLAAYMVSNDWAWPGGPFIARSTSFGKFGSRRSAHEWRSVVRYRVRAAVAGSARGRGLRPLRESLEGRTRAAYRGLP